MDWKEVGRSLVSQGMPLVGGLLGGPAGAAVGRMVSGVFGADPESPEEVMNAIQSDPDAITKLREFEMKHKEKLEELQIEETKAFLADVQSARSREAATVAATGERDTHLYILAYIVVASFFGLAGYLLYGVIAKSETSTAVDAIKNNPLIMLLIGALISGFTQVLSYFFGSSKGSSEKTKMMSAKG